MKEMLVVIKGGGDVATGVAHKLFNCGFRIIIIEIEKPTVERRLASFAQAVYTGEHEVEGVRAKLAQNISDISDIIEKGEIPIVVDPTAKIIENLRPQVVVDAIMSKRNIGTKITDAPIVIGLGPSFVAGKDVHAVIETNPGCHTGKVIYSGAAEKQTGIPCEIEGETLGRLIISPTDGILKYPKDEIIGDYVREGEQIASVNGEPVIAQINGVILGIRYKGLYIQKELRKLGDIDPRGIREYCFTISDRSRAIGGGVLETILTLRSYER